MNLVKMDLDMHHDNDSITVVVYMITYNHGPFIFEAIDSVLQQKTNFNFKIVIGDDCSTDNTSEICLKFKASYPDIIDLVINDHNMGATLNAKNIFLKCIQSGARYIAMLEGDDYWTDPFKLQKQVDFLDSHPDVSVCFHDYLLLNGTTFSPSKYDFQRNVPVQLKEYYFNSYNESEFWVTQPLTAVFKSSSLDSKIFDLYKNFKDYHLFYHLLKAGKGYYMSIVMGVYRQHYSGVFTSTSNLSRMEEDYKIKRDIYLVNNDLNYKRYYEGAVALYLLEQIKLKPRNYKKIYEILLECFNVSIYSFIIIFLKSIYYHLTIRNKKIGTIHLSS